MKTNSMLLMGLFFTLFATPASWAGFQSSGGGKRGVHLQCTGEFKSIRDGKQTSSQFNLEIYSDRPIMEYRVGLEGSDFYFSTWQPEYRNGALADVVNYYAKSKTYLAGEAKLIITIPGKGTHYGVFVTTVLPGIFGQPIQVRCSGNLPETDVVNQ